jgi:hypothetical protein
LEEMRLIPPLIPPLQRNQQACLRY